MKNKAEILQILNEQRKYIEETYEVDKIGLFGSYAKGTQSENSQGAIFDSIQKEVIYG